MNDNELEKLIPKSIELTVGGEQLTITPIKVKELSSFTRAISPMMDTFNEAGRDELISKLIFNHTYSLIKATAIAARKTEDFVNQLDIDELVDLVTAIIEVNIDFFMQKVLPKITLAIDRLGGSINLDGPMPTSSSENMD